MDDHGDVTHSSYSVSPPTSPPWRYSSPISEVIENRTSMLPQDCGKEVAGEITYARNVGMPPDSSAPEVVQEGHFNKSQYGRSPPVHIAEQGPSPFPNMEKHSHQEGMSSPPENGRKIWGISKRRFFTISIVLCVLGLLSVGFGVGLSVGLKRNRPEEVHGTVVSDPFCRDKPDLCIGGALNAEYFSRKGAFNGSAISILLTLHGRLNNQEGANIKSFATLFFQHHTGSLRFMRMKSDETWSGGTTSEIVAQDAKNGTPISLVAWYNLFTNTTYIHLYYVSHDSYIKQRFSDSNTNIWQNGPLNSQNLSVHDSPTAKLHACNKGDYFSASDFEKFNHTNNRKLTEFDAQGISIWFAVDESTFEQYTWFGTTEKSMSLVWARVGIWQEKNIHSNIECYSHNNGSATIFMTNHRNEIETWWKDSNPKNVSTSSHPIDVWKKSNLTFMDIQPLTPLSYMRERYLFAQMVDRSFKGFNVTYQAENSTLANNNNFTFQNSAGQPELGIRGTALDTSIWLEDHPPNDTRPVNDRMFAFFQAEGDDITMIMKPLKGGVWSKQKLPIPDE